jgi:pyruvate/2-oxoglutarate dehydrogenase complex dihydrolipoamide dehydrogenase (E3) component
MSREAVRPGRDPAAEHGSPGMTPPTRRSYSGAGIGGLARALGCELRDDGSIAVDANQATTVDRVHAAGNSTDPRALVPMAAGSGVAAAVAISARVSIEDADRAVSAPRADPRASEVR